MRKASFAAAAAAMSLALFCAACGPPPDDDIDDIEELPDQDDLGEPDGETIWMTSSHESEKARL